VWACDRGQTHRHTDARDPYISRPLYDSREMYNKKVTERTDTHR